MSDELRPKWEYGVCFLDGDTVAAANEAGAEGWEIVQLTVLPPESGHLVQAFLKRKALLVFPPTAGRPRTLVLPNGAPHG